MGQTDRDFPCFPISSYFAYWGKARPAEGESSFHLLPYHCLDVAAVGRVYLRRAPALLSWLSDEFGFADKDALCDWITFWLALHDLGKFSTSFQGQRADLAEELQGKPLITAGLPGVRHDSLGMQFWTEHIQPIAITENWFGEDPDLFDGIDYWARAVTGHHGQPPLSAVSRLSRHFCPDDVVATKEFVQDMRALLLPAAAAAMPASIEKSMFNRNSRDFSWWIAGLGVLSDWIGSNAEIFRYRACADMSLIEYWKKANLLAETALNQSGILPAARQEQRSFSELFRSKFTPSPLQQWASSVDISVKPQIYLLEDVTGAGKTEAAIMLMHRLMANGCADGFFIGLPTMATANAMYERVAAIYSDLFAEKTSLVLAHGRKTLVESFAVSVIRPGAEEHDPNQLDESATRRCTSWLADHNKRALLASAGVGTVDQALLGALQSKHQSLRLLGLMRKVLVIDEVHACDPYMQKTLESLLEFHARAGGSAILLSATLTTRMKTGLLRAFARGCAVLKPAYGRPTPLRPTSLCMAYPLATSWSADQGDSPVEKPLATRPDVRRTVDIEYKTDRDEVIKEIISTLAAGHCVAWIRNTVGDALEARNELAVHVSTEKIILFHARFALGDRLNKEDVVLRHFGPESEPGDRAGRLLIGTQVLESSLDLDFDLVISDLAPVDRLIQRAGRLRRHVRNEIGRRIYGPDVIDMRGRPCLWILAPAWDDNPSASWFKKYFPKAAGVYQHHGHLWLTAKALRSGQFTMPDDARSLIENVFGEEDELPDGLRHNANQAEGKAYADQSIAVINSVKLIHGYAREGMDWAADTVAPSRLGEETVEVLLARWRGDELTPWCDDKPSLHAWAYSTVRVAKRLIAAAVPETSSTRIDAVRDQLERLPGGGKWVVLLPLELVEGRYIGSTQTAASKGASSRVITWMYDAAIGLVDVATPGGEPPGAQPHRSEEQARPQPSNGSSPCA